MKPAKSTKAFEAKLVEAGAELLAPTNPYEALRFRTKYGVGVVYASKRGETWNIEAEQARDHLRNKSGSLAPVKVRGRRTDKGTVARLLTRDGENCFYCDEPLGQDITVEHLVSIAHGGPNHISNLFLAHAACNQKAGHMSAPEKIKLALHQRSPRPRDKGLLIDLAEGQ